MIDYDKLLNLAPYSLDKDQKREYLDKALLDLTRHHYECCPEYKRILDAFHVDLSKDTGYYELPFLPVRLFKEFDLKSVPGEVINKTMTSSGTTGQKTSKIYLDKESSARQTRVLTKITSDFIGTKRLPMLILDTSAVIKNRAMFSARGAGILGFSMFGRDKFYALDENMNLDINGMKAFLEKHSGETIFLFGFTFMIWQHFVHALESTGYHPDLSNGILIHGGGWKKLESERVSKEAFKQRLKDVCSITQIHDYYGMVEQTGTVYMECECGHLHAPVYSDIIIRRAQDFSPAAVGEEGLIEVVSILPYSYPGHILLTEDSGVLLGEDDCPCGRKGKYFEVKGRIKNAEIRGCSDTYASRF